MIRALRNPVTSARDDEDRARLVALFPSLQGRDDVPYLALRPYLDGCPERFLDRSVHDLMLTWLRGRDARQHADLEAHLAGSSDALSRALLFLRQVNAEDWHDRLLTKGDELEVLRFIDTVLHPAYLRLTEGVLVPLLRPAARFSRLDRGVSPDGLDTFNVVDELRSGPLGPCVAVYDNIVRNGIGHGGITYGQSEITYRDKKGHSTVLDVWTVIRLCDDLLDVCNGLAAAFKVFFIESVADGHRMPLELMFEELIESTKSPWWTIGGCLETRLPGARQLLIYARPESRDSLKVQWASVQSAALAEWLAPGYDRYFFSLRGSRSLPGWAAFSGERLRSLRESGAAQVHEFVPAADAPGIFYKPNFPLPRLIGRLDTLAKSLVLHWPIARRQIREALGAGQVIGRHGSMHRNGWRYVLEGAVVIDGVDPTVAGGSVRRNSRRIVRAAKKVALRSLGRLDVVRYLPLGYARISVVDRDFRRRRLYGFGLGPELVCTVQKKRIGRIRSPDIMGSTIEQAGSWRIAWNRSWLESGGSIDR